MNLMLSFSVYAATNRKTMVSNRYKKVLSVDVNRISLFYVCGLCVMTETCHFVLYLGVFSFDSNFCLFCLGVRCSAQREPFCVSN